MDLISEIQSHRSLKKKKKKKKKKNKERKFSNENLKKSAEVGNDGNLSHLAIEGIFYVP